MATESTFNGNNIGYMTLIRPDSTPQRLQEQHFSGIDGESALYHGVKGRVLEFDGVLNKPNEIGAYLALLTDVGSIQNYINSVAPLVHYVADTFQIYNYCQMLEYYRYGPWGFNVNEIIVRFRATFKQLYW